MRLIVKIDEIHIFHVAMPLKDPWITAYGADFDTHSILLKLTSGNNIAWAETCSLELPTYSSESANSVFHNISEVFSPKILGNDYESSEQLNNDLKIYKGNPFAKAGLDIGWWCLLSQTNNLPLHDLFGGKRKEVIAGADFGVEDSIDILIEKIQVAIDNNAPRVKLKVRKGWDLEVLKAVKSTFPDTLFHIDCNSGYTLEDIDFFKSIDAMGLAFIEQPLSNEDIFDHSKLAREIDTPICLDESINSVDRARQAIEIGACEYINIKPGRVGGITNSLKINEISEQAGIPVWIGGMLESALGVAICIELATLANFTYPGDLFPSSRFYANDLFEPYNEFKSPYLFDPITNLPKPNEKLLKKFTVKEKHLQTRTS